MHLESLWAMDAPTHVKVGEVVDGRGKALDLRRLIQRRWGWPKKAAMGAVDALEDRYGDEIGMRLPISGPERVDLQRKLLEWRPDLLPDLLEGVANRAQREASSAHRPLSEFRVVFESTIQDEGFVTGVLHVLAGRLGITVDALRDRVEFTNDGGDVLTIAVWTDGLEG